MEAVFSAQYSSREVPDMNRPELMASVLTGSIVLIAVLYRLLVAGQQITAMSALGRLPGIPKRAQAWINHWLLDIPEPRTKS
jgi:hypothetical protein